MVKRILIISLIFFIRLEVSGQINKYGVPVIKNYNTQVTQGAEYNWSIVKDKSGVLYFGNDDKGIIRYDGMNWTSIPVRNDPLIRTLGVDKNGVIYVGGAYEFGFLEPEKNGKLSYVSLSARFDEPTSDSSLIHPASDSGLLSGESVRIGEIHSMVVTDSVVYFVSSESIFIYNIQNDNIDYINLRSLNFKQIVKISLVGNRIILADNLLGLFELKNRKLEMLPGGDFFKMKICLVLLTHSGNKMIVGTYSDGVFLYDYSSGEVVSRYLPASINSELKTAQIYTGVLSPSDEIVLGTINEGVFVLTKDGELLYRWSKETSELQDNTITALYSGNTPDSELWVSSAGFVSKVYVNLPFTEFSTKSGLDGIVNNISEFNNEIFAATDIGLFKSYISPAGLKMFEKVNQIDDQVFCLYKASVGTENFLLAGSNQGLYQVRKDGKISRVEDNISNIDINRTTSFYVRSIVQSKLNPGKFYIGLNSKGINILDYDGKTWKMGNSIRSIPGIVAYMIENNNGDLFVYAANPDGLYRLPANDTIPVLYSTVNGLPEATLFSISVIEDNIVVSTGKGIYRYESSNDSWVPADDIIGGLSEGIQCIEIYDDSEGGKWLEFVDSRIYESVISKSGDSITSYTGSLNLLPNVKKLDFKNIDNKIWMAKSKSIYVIDKKELFQKDRLISPLFTKLVIGSDSIIMEQTFYSTLENGRRVTSAVFQGSKVPEFTYNFNEISFFWSTPYYIEEDAILYSYKLEGFDKDWSKWEKIYYKDFTNLPYGQYKFMVKARTVSDIVSSEAIYTFNILKPWYFTVAAFFLYSVIVLFLIYIIIKAYTRRLKNENIRLEGIVAERTAVVVKQKEELESSIHYASRIQRALLPSEQLFSENIKNYFILFKPRDIVSGDFYWLTKKDNRLYIVAADCTGHGVPGAFMSLLGMSFLDEIIDKETSPRADKILSELRSHVIESLKQVGGADEAKDGMDIALVVIDFDTERVEFSGAYNPCFRVRKLNSDESKSYANDESEMSDGCMSNGVYVLETIRASKMPIGISSRMNEKFIFYDWKLEKGISYYLFSDGYIDQFGGPHGRKFMKKKFKKLILDIQEYPMKRQKEILEKTLNDWMGNVPQVDDILVMGIRPE